MMGVWFGIVVWIISCDVHKMSVGDSLVIKCGRGGMELKLISALRYRVKCLL